jgi:20S proteasome alpha/beta subunit
MSVLALDVTRRCCVKSKDTVVLLTLKRSPAELSSYQRKTFKIDDHIGIALSGLIADGRVLCKFMRNECLNHRCGRHRRLVARYSAPGKFTAS